MGHKARDNPIVPEARHPITPYKRNDSGAQYGAQGSRQSYRAGGTTSHYPLTNETTVERSMGHKARDNPIVPEARNYSLSRKKYRSSTMIPFSSTKARYSSAKEIVL